MNYDYLIVGAGLFGSVFAREMTDQGYKCLILEKRNHIGGNCYSEKIENIDVHIYGPHIFHTKDKAIWDYVNKYTPWRTYQNRVKHLYKNKVLSFPINLMTLHQIWGVVTPEEAQKKLDQVRIKNGNPQNLEEWILSQVGQELYDIFIKGYTTKQWRRDPKDLPVDIIKRLPIRMVYNDKYFDADYEGLPIEGYDVFFNNLLSGIEVKLGTDYLLNRGFFNSLATHILYTGKIDEFYDFKLGPLEYNDLMLKTEVLPIKDFQGCAVMNFPDIEIPYTRRIEYKHFLPIRQENCTAIMHEFPVRMGEGIPSYPVNTKLNDEKYSDYLKLNNEVFFGGRLGSYKYCDMDATIKQARTLAKELQETNKKDKHV